MKTSAVPQRNSDYAIRAVAELTLLNSTKNQMPFQPALRHAMAKLGIDLDIHEQFYLLTDWIPMLLDEIALSIIGIIAPKLNSSWEEERRFAASFRRAARHFRIYENKNPRLYKDLFKKTLGFAREQIPQKQVFVLDRGPRHHLRKLRRDPFASLFVPALERLAA